MYDPLFNSVLVEINDKDAAWGSGNDESMLGKSYSKGMIVKISKCFPTQAYPYLPPEGETVLFTDFKDLVGKAIMWNEGTEAGTTFEHDGKLYGMIYWFDIRGVASEA